MVSQFLPRATLTPPTRADGPTADHLVRRETGKECWECSLAEWVQLPPLPGPATGDRQRGGSPPPPTYLPPSGGDPTHNGPTFGESDGVRPCHHNSSCPQSSPERFIPQKRLAEEVTRLVHGGTTYTLQRGVLYGACVGFRGGVDSSKDCHTSSIWRAPVTEVSLWRSDPPPLQPHSLH